MADSGGAYLMPLKGLWFGRNNGSHLSYGECGKQDRIFNDMMIWTATEGRNCTCISAPNKFASGADGSGVSITPQVKVKVTWNGRWFNLAVLVICLVLWRLRGGLHWLKLKPRHEPTAESKTGNLCDYSLIYLLKRCWLQAACASIMSVARAST
jgi:hypothetical protein